jgi:hypothetical protein
MTQTLYAHMNKIKKKNFCKCYNVSPPSKIILVLLIIKKTNRKKNMLFRG